MQNKLQEMYNEYIRLANKNYLSSKIDVYEAIQSMMAAKAEAFEIAADHLYSKFYEEITPITTMRFDDLTQSHFEEVVEEKRKADNA